MTKRWTRDEINSLIRNRNDAVERGIVAIFNRQTEDEKDSQSTRHRNNRGFNATDARKGTYYARWVLSGRNLTRHHLDNARRMCLKYSGQLVEVANKR